MNRGSEKAYFNARLITTQPKTTSSGLRPDCFVKGFKNYFDSEGETEPLLLVIPKGGYTPEFVSRQKLTTETSPVTPINAVQRASLVRWLFIAIAVLAVVVAFQSWHLFKPKPAQAEPASPELLPSSVNALWSQLLSERLTTTVIVPDATIGMLQEITNQPVDLGTYLRRSPVNDNQKVKEIEEVLRGFSIRRYTTFDSVSTGVKITELAQQFHSTQPSGMRER